MNKKSQVPEEWEYSHSPVKNKSNQTKEQWLITNQYRETYDQLMKFPH